MLVPFCNLSPIARLYPTLILPLQRGGDLSNGISEQPRRINTPGKSGSILDYAVLGQAFGNTFLGKVALSEKWHIGHWVRCRSLGRVARTSKNST